MSPRDGFDDLPESTEVLIVGGGPVGLGASLLLTQLGIDHIIIERRAEAQTAPAAHVINARTFEILRSVGVGGREIEAACQPVEEGAWVRWVTSLTGTELGKVPFERHDQMEALDAITPTPLRNLSQHRLEPILRSKVEGLITGVEWLSATQDETSVVSTLQRRGSETTRSITSKFLIAADGAGSAVRRWSGVGMEGPDVLQAFVMIHAEVDLSGLLGDRPATLYWTLDPSHRGCFVAHDLTRTWVFMYEWDPEAEDISTFTDERCRDLFRSAAGTDDIDPVITTVRPWRMTSQIAEHYRVGRVFLTGDAAHRFPPSGGLGLNTGVADVHNLAWKLGAVLRGWAGEALLNSYEKERRPVAVTNANKSRENPMTMFDVYLAAGLAETEEESIANFERAVNSPEGRRAIATAAEAQAEHFDMLGLQLGFRYPPDGAVILDDGVVEPAPGNPVREYRPSSQPGARMPHVWLERDGQKISSLDLVEPDRMLVVTGSASWGQGSKRLEDDGARLTTVEIGVQVEDPSGSWASSMGCDPKGVLVVRPDGHVAFRADGESEHPEAVLRDALATMGVGK